MGLLGMASDCQHQLSTMDFRTKLKCKMLKNCSLAHIFALLESPGFEAGNSGSPWLWCSAPATRTQLTSLPQCASLSTESTGSTESTAWRRSSSLCPWRNQRCASWFGYGRARLSIVIIYGKSIVLCHLYHKTSRLSNYSGIVAPCPNLNSFVYRMDLDSQPLGL